MKLRYTLPALADLAAILDTSPPIRHRERAGSKPAFGPSPNLLLRYPQYRQPHERSSHPADDRDASSLSGFYEATENEIIIHAVRHAARDPSGMPGSA